MCNTIHIFKEVPFPCPVLLLYENLESFVVSFRFASNVIIENKNML